MNKDELKIFYEGKLSGFEIGWKEGYEACAKLYEILHDNLILQSNSRDVHIDPNYFFKMMNIVKKDTDNWREKNDSTNSAE